MEVVKVFHCREEANNKRGWVHSGVTIAIIWDGNERYVGLAKAKGQWSRKIGHEIAVGRARALRAVTLGLKPKRGPRSSLWNRQLTFSFAVYNRAVYLGTIPTASLQVLSQYAPDFLWQPQQKMLPATAGASIGALPN